MRLLNTGVFASSDKAHPRLSCGQHFEQWIARSGQEQLQRVLSQAN